MRELDGGLFQLQPWRLTLNGESETPKPALLTSGFTRSEEHTSELQSQSNLVCRLLLEKKKNTAASTARLDRYIRYLFLPGATPLAIRRHRLLPHRYCFPSRLLAPSLPGRLTSALTLK